MWRVGGKGCLRFAPDCAPLTLRCAGLRRRGWCLGAGGGRMCA